MLQWIYRMWHQELPMIERHCNSSIIFESRCNYLTKHNLLGKYLYRKMETRIERDSSGYEFTPFSRVFSVSVIVLHDHFEAQFEEISVHE